jgi:hypothetical protein
VGGSWLAVRYPLYIWSLLICVGHVVALGRGNKTVILCFASTLGEICSEVITGFPC